jgi:23S rRNA (cytosine1962-C5)-methyltransferase
VAEGDGPAGIVRVTDRRGLYLGQALWSPTSEIRLRLLTRDEEPIGSAFWSHTTAEALRRRAHLVPPATAYRVVHGEGDGLPSLIVDRYGDYVVAQLLSAGLESVRADILAAIEEVLRSATRH